MCESWDRAILILGLSTGGLNTARGLTALFSGDLSSNRLHGFGPTTRQLSLRSVYIVSNKKIKMKKRRPVRTTLLRSGGLVLPVTAFLHDLPGLLAGSALGTLLFAVGRFATFVHLPVTRGEVLHLGGLGGCGSGEGGGCHHHEGEGKDQGFHLFFTGGFNPALDII